MLELIMLPARQGDALFVSWGNQNHPHRMIIDMGTEEVGENIRTFIETLAEDQRTFDLLIVSHVDRDHIGGVLTCLAEADPIPGLTIEDLWFNGFKHLSGGFIDPTGGENNAIEGMGPAQGERLSSWLRQQNWNKAFSGGPVVRVPGETPKTITLYDDLKLTVLGPTPEKLKAFIDTWTEEVHEALAKGNLEEVSPGLEPMGSKEPPVLEEQDDLVILAETANSSDKSEANASSIAVLLQYKGCNILLSGDAHSEDLVEGIDAISGDNPIELEAFKLPHHGSKKNIFKPLIEAVACKRWLFSTDGTQFRHPDAVALARVITYSTVRTPILSFNVPSTYNGWWNNSDWKAMYDYETEYGTEQSGLKLKFIPKSN